MGLLTVTFTNNESGVNAFGSGADTLPVIRFDRDVVPGNWHLIKVLCQTNLEGGPDLNWTAAHHRSILVKMRDLSGNDLFHRGGVMAGKFGTYIPSAFVASQTYRPYAANPLPGAPIVPTNQEYTEDAVFTTDSVVRGIQFDLRFMDTVQPVESIRLFSLTFQVPCSSDQFMSE